MHHQYRIIIPVSLRIASTLLTQWFPEYSRRTGSNHYLTMPKILLPLGNQVQQGRSILRKCLISWWSTSLQSRHIGRDGVWNHQPHHCLLNRLFRRRSKKASKPRVTGLCAGNSPVTGEFPAQMASNAGNVSIWWRHHAHSLKTPVELTSPPENTFSLSAVYGSAVTKWHGIFFALITPEETSRGLCWLTKENLQWKTFPTVLYLS